MYCYLYIILSVVLLFLIGVRFLGVHWSFIFSLIVPLLSCLIWVWHLLPARAWMQILLYIEAPALLCVGILYARILYVIRPIPNKKYRVKLYLKNGSLVLDNIRRGISIIGAAGSGKTESVVFNLLQHLGKHSFCGVMHDYKHFELTEIAYPLFQQSGIPFYIISPDKIYHRVNPIAPRYLEHEESVNEVSRVLLENLLEMKESGATGTSRFFNDAVEGLIAGMILKLKEDYPQYCTLPHMMALYQLLDTDSLINFLVSNRTSKAMADAFISGRDSERQTAGVKSTLANAFKKISTKRLFALLSADEVPLDVNNQDNPAIVSLVNNPLFETSYSPILATILHTITKQMSVRHRLPSFVLMEEAPTIRLLNMHRIPASLRSYDIATLYVLQDKIQNDLLYGDKASKAILSNLSYQFFGKANDPDTAKYYEQFFEIVKMKTTSISKGEWMNPRTRITKSEKEVAKIRADRFFRLKPGEFVAFADGREKRVRFKKHLIEKSLPPFHGKAVDVDAEFLRVYSEVRNIFTHFAG
ncbi:type IV secretory system conjugative DNA transfer family protein [Joostella atrarenae]|uniref:Type IV secretory system conjugative DNA transfer family protein n=1 Tax=Joostella atrarenae TaxID=679257 RepID=A0ABS9J7I5_9FLAO|nr:type IV secretory system conjugative DNA transfer family protein [Joostella atrarenae]MCF8716370.1 type IV secretory system conjugative DNA transfer family protein [Joostella atrarenae]